MRVSQVYFIKSGKAMGALFYFQVLRKYNKCGLHVRDVSKHVLKRKIYKIEQLDHPQPISAKPNLLSPRKMQYFSPSTHSLLFLIYSV